jgi:hypothetical protein
MLSAAVTETFSNLFAMSSLNLLILTNYCQFMNGILNIQNEH